MSESVTGREVIKSGLIAFVGILVCGSLFAFIMSHQEGVWEREADKYLVKYPELKRRYDFLKIDGRVSYDDYDEIREMAEKIFKEGR